MQIRRNNSRKSSCTSGDRGYGQGYSLSASQVALASGPSVLNSGLHLTGGPTASKQHRSKPPFCDGSHTAGVRVVVTYAYGWHRMECVMAVRDTWEKMESGSKSFAAIGIPVVLVFASLFANQA